MEADKDTIVEVPDGPEAFSVLEDRLYEAVRSLVGWVREENAASSLWTFEKLLLPRIALLYQLAVALFIAVRREGLDLEQCRATGWRIKQRSARRAIQTLHGTVSYGRAYLTRRQGGGWFPLDAALGITRDGFSWRVIDVVTRLATRLSYAAVKHTLSGLIGWSPSPEAIERLTIGLGQHAPAFMETQGPLEGDGEVLVIEVDGKAAPMVTEEELAARRRPRRKGTGCCCKRHRNREHRAGKRKKRKKRGNNSKNGRSATLVAMYTLRRDADGQLHGPINKKIWGQFGTRKAAVQWARKQATRRGFGPKSKRTVQIVVDGERCLREYLQRRFPKAIITLDLRHAQERLWKAGRQFHKEGSVELEQWVEPLNELLVNGEITGLLRRLKQLRDSIAPRGPNTAAKRNVLDEQLRYFTERRAIMRYGEYHRAGLVLATGVIEGACRYVVAERLDCSGMRWSLDGAQPVLQLRCIELNGDWEQFMEWVTTESSEAMISGKAVQVRRPVLKPIAEPVLETAA